MLGLIPLPWKIAAALGLVVALGIFGGWAYLHGRTDAKNAAAARTLEETEKGRKARETNDEDARTMDDKKALECLRRPAGC
jgi:hypothetical protein